MQLELAIDEAKLLWRDKAPMRDAYPIERSIEIGGPEMQEMQEFRKFGREIEVLPDIGLQQTGIIRQPVQDLCGGEGESFKLTQ